MIVNKIPIQNIYFMLCYAWEKVALTHLRPVDATVAVVPSDLFAHILANGTMHFLQRGLMHDYQPQREPLSTLRGRVDWRETLATQAHRRGKLVCEYENWLPDILPNQILKTTFSYLLKTQNIDKQILKNIKNIYLKFNHISIIQLDTNIWALAEAMQKDIFYDFLIKICRLIHQQLLVDEIQGTYLFKDLETTQIHRIFEDFVRNFYAKEQQKFKVSRPKISWQLKKERVTEGGDLLPLMQTDMCLFNEQQKIIIDTKFYSNTLQENFGKSSIHSSHLYQIFSYLMHQENSNCKGILLYPTVQRQLSQTYRFEERGRSHDISIETVDLSVPYQNIKKRLLKIIDLG